MKLLLIPASTSAKAGPIRTFRDPGNPGNVNVTSACAAAGLENKFGSIGFPLPSTFPVFLVTWVERGVVRVPDAVRKKFVGKLNPFAGLSGNPECHLMADVNSQPPIRAFSKRLESPP